MDRFTPGNALCCPINSHRHGWNAAICENAAAWNCGAQQDFRERYCQQDDGRCFHIRAFDEKAPAIEMDNFAGGQILAADPHALDDQLLILWGREYHEPTGIPERFGVRKSAFGVYRVKSVEGPARGPRGAWRIVPYPDGWVRLPKLLADVPPFREFGLIYFREVERAAVERMFQQVATAPQPKWFDPADRKRFELFHKNLAAWLDSAKATMERQRATKKTVVAPPAVPKLTPVASVKPVAVAPAPPKSRATPNDVDAAWTPEPLVDARRGEWIVANYGQDVLTSIQIASLSKPLLIVRGRPGVGKSTLVNGLIDDPDGKRKLVVAVASTWRGREDLLGYINPIHNEFEPTAFTSFLRDAAQAWDQGDRKNRLVIFEEFNLSQPEFWLSDVLVRSQFAPGDRTARTIELGGASVRGWGKGEARVFLSPAVRFAATVNDDHTTRSLSPRVIDRAAVIELWLEPADALQRVKVELAQDQVAAISELDFTTRTKGASFSLRTAMSLKRCVDRAGAMELDAWSVIDRVLAQELLSKIRLMVGDPTDHRLLGKLKEWTATHAEHMPECARIIEAWDETLKEGLDVV